MRDRCYPNFAMYSYAMLHFGCLRHQSQHTDKQPMSTLPYSRSQLDGRPEIRCGAVAIMSVEKSLAMDVQAQCDLQSCPDDNSCETRQVFRSF